MALYYENGTFGGGCIQLTGVDSTTKYFGSKVNEASVADSATGKTYLIVTGVGEASPAKGVDIGKATGNYKDQYTVRFSLAGKSGLNATDSVEVTIAGSADDVTYTTDICTMKFTGKELDDSMRTPVEMMIPSFGKYRYFCLGIKTAGTPTGGELTVAIEPTAW